MKIKKPESFNLKFHYTQIRSFEDACKRLKRKPTDVYHDRDLQHEVAYKKLITIYEAINNGWEPNWTDRNQLKYFPWFEVSDNGLGFSFVFFICVFVHAYVGGGLYTYDSEVALYIGNQFMKEYRQYILKLN